MGIAGSFARVAVAGALAAAMSCAGTGSLCPADALAQAAGSAAEPVGQAAPAAQQQQQGQQAQDTAQSGQQADLPSHAAGDARDADRLTAGEREDLEDLVRAEKKAKTAVGALAAPMDELGDRADQLEKARGRLEKARTAASAAKSEFDSASAEVDELESAAAALEAEGHEETDIFSLIFGSVTFDELVDQEMRRAEDADALADRLEEARDRVDRAQGSMLSAIVVLEKRSAEVSEAVDAGNEVAYELEKLDSRSRMADEDADEAAGKLPTEKPAAAEAVKGADDAEKSHDASREKAREVLARWYGATDALSGVGSSLVFGCGADFALPKDEFVAKWGGAIDRFLEGRGAPLAGQGGTMARCAYEYKVDPRLCAAVSIVESSGGAHCIKSCNAWGWGAADSDPYGGAASWGSWEEAIEAWHEGMSASKTGLADAGTISGVGQVYCSSAHWAGSVADLFGEIDACL